MALGPVDYKPNPQTCSEGARWMVNPDCGVSLEDSVTPTVREELARRGHRIVSAEAPMLGFGDAQLIHRHED